MRPADVFSSAARDLYLFDKIAGHLNGYRKVSDDTWRTFERLMHNYDALGRVLRDAGFKSAFDQPEPYEIEAFLRERLGLPLL